MYKNLNSQDSIIFHSLKNLLLQDHSKLQPQVHNQLFDVENLENSEKSRMQ